MVSSVVVLLLSALAAAESSAPVPISYCDLIGTHNPRPGRKLRCAQFIAMVLNCKRLDPADCCPAERLKIWVENGILSWRSKKFLNRFPKGMGLA
jgi:hypothetical protein